MRGHLPVSRYEPEEKTVAPGSRERDWLSAQLVFVNIFSVMLA
jgi:hypothetical protein